MPLNCSIEPSDVENCVDCMVASAGRLRSRRVTDEESARTVALVAAWSISSRSETRNCPAMSCTGTRIAEGSYGYKLLVLLNVQEDCELVVGDVLGGLHESEIPMLRRRLARLNQTVGPLREGLQILLMDRGYWGTDLFCELKQDYGIDFVSRVRDEKLAINESIQRQREEQDRSWSGFQEERQFAGRRETQRVRTTALASITLIGDEAPHRAIAVNVVVAEQAHADGTPILDRHGKDISTTKYVTSLRPGLHGIKVRGFYRSRWGVENQGFRYLSQTWEIDRLAGHSYGAVLARLRLFSFISSNWRGEPLRDYETIVNLISRTTTAKGLQVSCRLDRRKYPTGRKVTDEEIRRVNLKQNKFHGDWNYAIHPSTN